MAQDFAKKNKNYPKITAANKKVKKEKAKSGSKKLLILFFTLSIVITCCLVIYIQNGMTYKLELAKNDKDLLPSPKFEFYKILPNKQAQLIEEKPKVQTKISLNNEVKVQDLNPPTKKLEKKIEGNKIEQNKEEIKENNKQAITNKNEYFLQLASFKDYKDADNMRAKLILSGIDVDIFQAKLNSGAVWYRVRSKKMTNYQEVENLKNKLLAFRVKAIILRNIG